MFLKVNEKNFDKLIRKHNQLVLIYHASWADPCKKMRVRMRRICRQYQDIKFGIIDADNNEQLCLKYNVYFLPTLLYLYDGKPIEKLCSLKKCKEIKSWLGSLFEE